MKLPGTKPALAFELLSKIQSIPLEKQTKEKIIPLVREYWEAEDNTAARNHPLTAKEMTASNTEFFNRLWSPPADIEQINFILPTVIKVAQKDSQSLETLKNMIAEWMQSDCDIPRPIREVTADILIGKFNRKGKGNPTAKADPQHYHRDLQLALAVKAVHQGSNKRFPLGESNSDDGAFDIVGKASGVESETVRIAWRKHKSSLKA